MPSTPTLRPILKRRLALAGGARAWLGLSVLLGIMVAGLTACLARANLFGYELGELPEDVALPAGFLAAAILFFVAVAHDIEVGVDGVRARRYGRRRFFPYRDIVGGRLLMGTTGRRRIELDLRGGASPQMFVGGIGPDEARAIMIRILEEREAYAASTSEADVHEALEPNGRSVEIWRAEVTRLVGAGDYRHARISAADALDTLENAAAPAARRLGAAMALSGAGGGPEVVERIRIVAGASANPQLRAALAAIAEGEIDPEALEAAIATSSRIS